MSSFNVRQKLSANQLRARKSLGQNFIHDENLLRKIVRHAGDVSRGSVLEIGPGPGGLTQAILEAGARKVVAVEKDRRFSPILSELAIAFPNRLSVILKDALEIDLRDISDSPLKVIANLPYQISTVLLIKWITDDIWKSNCKSLTLMFQKEVAERIVAGPGSRKRSRLGLLTELYTEAKILFRVPASCFIPVPKVDSSLVHFEIRKAPKYRLDPAKLNIILRSAFNQKRKMLKSSLKPLFPDVKKALNTAGIIETQRPEALELKQFCELSLIHS
ncbi:MAG: 16S rRNA (adenine(1518)-N(6)/adenine(1519)-N(6))-dimethyltransferase RsmA [Pseudomonadota bacterium]|nr:16S rRNA (adenine(1518)-N(6)/adenine(1519)-N(6))-dimethyltransferase RsmA [Pseudomonadota bacterium]